MGIFEILWSWNEKLRVPYNTISRSKTKIYCKFPIAKLPIKRFERKPTKVLTSAEDSQYVDGGLRRVTRAFRF